MSEPFIGQILLVGFNFEPRGWAFCNGQLLAIAQNTALFSLLGTTYGGNGTNNFALPDLRSRVPLHFGQGAGLSPYVLGEMTGTENVSLLATQMPAHSHLINASAANADAFAPTGAFLAETNAGRGGVSSNTYASTQAEPTTLNPASIASAGGSQPHTNIQPVLALNFIIALEGIFPSRS